MCILHGSIFTRQKNCTTKQLGNDSSNSPLDKCATGSFAHNSSYTYLRYLNPHRRKFAPRSEAKLTRIKDTNFSPFCSQCFRFFLSPIYNSHVTLRGEQVYSQRILAKKNGGSWKSLSIFIAVADMIKSAHPQLD